MRRILDSVLQSPFGPWCWILFPVFLAALPHFLRLPAWIGLVCVLLWVMRLYAVVHPKLLPSRVTRLALTLGCIAGVYASYGRLLGPEPGTSLLLLLMGLKPFEAGSRRDYLLILFMAYLLILLQFLHSRSLLAAAYMIPVFLLVTASWIGTAHPASRSSLLFRLRRATVMTVQALPVMLILFLLFPRMPGSLWGLFDRPETGLTGLSDTMSPGDINELLQSSEVVFRVAFDDSAPDVGRMYWRVLVLWETDGRTWRAGAPDREAEAWNLVPLQEPIQYVLTLEAHGKRWLPALEMPTQVPPNAEPAPDFRLQAMEEIRQRAQYRLLSSLEYRTEDLSPDDLRRALILPSAGNPRARVLAREWSEASRDNREIVQRALDHFYSNLFVYTLRPPLLGEEAVDEFLFRTRSGYCEHYASAFTFLMRAAGVPARVVIGYQGADFNPLGNYHVVRQYHAHAWSEVWLDDAGWTRVDPTSVLAPDRIAVGAEALVPNIDVPDIFSSREVRWMISAWRGLSQGWDAANTFWNQWVLDFGFERQRRFLERFGLSGTTRIERYGYPVLALAGSFVAVAVMYAIFLMLGRPSRDLADRSYALFCRRLARIGIVRKPQEGPLDFARRAARLRPDLAGSIHSLSNVYIRLRYAPDAETGEKTGFARMVRRFRPRKD
ncbi:transglutaminase TgpA family protein [Desulfonatronum parangueonense]